MQFGGKLTTFAAGMALAATTAVSAFAADVTLTISNWLPPTHAFSTMMWPGLIQAIEEATDGRVTAEVKYGLGSPPAQYDLVLDGAADMAFIFHGYQPGRFVATKLIELPGYQGSAEAVSVAYWRAHEKFFAAANEHKGVKLVALYAHGPGYLHSQKKVTSLDEISGMKLRIGGGVAGDVGAALGATGIRVPAPKVYETLASNAADGVMLPMEAIDSFKLYEVAKNTFGVPGGFYRGSFATIMNQEVFDNLSAADQAALEKVFGEAASRMAGKVFDATDAIGLESLNKHDDNTLNWASEADNAKWQSLTAPIIAKVEGEVAAMGIDAAAARAYIIEQIAAQ